MRILLIKLGARGDVLRSTSLLPAIHKKYPASSLDWAVDPPSREILAGNPLINKIHTAIENIDVKNYDLLINLDEDERGCRLAAEAGSKEGFYINEGRIVSTPSFDYLWRSGIYGPRPENDRLKKKNRKTYQRLLFEALGLPGDPVPPSYSPSSEDMKEADAFLNSDRKMSGPLAGINFSASAVWPAKRLPIRRTEEIARALEKEGYQVIIFGAADEREELGLLSERLGNALIADSLPLGIFASLIKKSGVLISTDSFALHISAAVGTPALGLFGPTSAAEVELFSRKRKLTAPLDCVCCYRKKCVKKPFCMDMFTAEVVLTSLREEGLLTG